MASEDPKVKEQELEGDEDDDLEEFEEIAGLAKSNASESTAKDWQAFSQTTWDDADALGDKFSEELARQLQRFKDSQISKKE